MRRFSLNWRRKMLKTLISIRLVSLWKAMFQTSNSKNSKGKQIALVLLMVYAFGAVGVSLGTLFSQLCKPLFDAGMSWLYFASIAILSFLLCFIGSIFTADSQLFEAKDNELLLSMPIPSRYILLSRVSVLVCTSVLFELLLVVPAAIVWIMQPPVTAIGAIFYILSFVIMPFLVLPLSCLCGWLIALITSKLRNRAAFTTALYIILTGGYFFLYNKLNSYIAMLISDGAPFAAAIKKAFPPFYWLGNAITEHNPLYLLLLFLCAAIPSAIIFVIISRSYFSIMMRPRRAARIKYKAKELKTSSAFDALRKKELSLFLARPMYMMNSGLGIIFLVIVAIMAAVKRADIEIALAQASPMLMGCYAQAVCLVLCLCNAMTNISAPSISLEGKNLWIIKSIPVPATVIFRSKMASHLSACLPFILLSGIICCITIGGNALTMAMYFILPTLSAAFCAVLGVFINLKFPKFDWISEVVAIKQGASTILTMFGSFVALIAPIIIYIAKGISVITPDTMLIIYAVYLVAITALFYSLTTRNADKKLSELG